jgi:hypothetical protein
MNTLSFDCIGLITFSLEIEDLVSLQKACRQFWFALKSNKLSFIWHGKIFKYYFKHWDKLRRKRQNYSSFEVFDIGKLFNYKDIDCECSIKRSFSKIESTSDWECHCLYF